MIKTRDKGEIVYYIPKGGSNLLGMLGYYDCAVELDEQAKTQHLTRGTVYVPVDTFSTYLGLYCGLKDINSPLNLVGIAVRPFGKEQWHELHEYFALAKKNIISTSTTQICISKRNMSAKDTIFLILASVRPCT